MIGQVLSPEQEEILAEERQALTDLVAALARLRSEPDDEDTLKRASKQLDRMFLLVVVGEFNAGKSALINTLLGEKLLDEGVTPTTRGIHILDYGEASESFTGGAQRILKAPVELLRHVNIVDTPGTNAIQRDHQAITEEFVPRADLILFVTSAERPFTDSERTFLETIRAWGKKILVVINKIDILEDPGSVAEVEKYVRDNIRRLLELEPELFPVSCRRAWLSRKAGEDSFPDSFSELERYITETLDQEERVRLKLLSPLGVALHLTDKYLSSLQNSLAVLREDLGSLQTVEAQQKTYEEDLRREFRFRLSDVRNVLHEFEARGVEFFDDRLRLSRVFELLNKSRLELDFKKKVIGDFPEEMERRVRELIDWMVSAEFNHWQDVMGFLNRRSTGLSKELVGEVGGRFQYDRSRLLNSVGRRAEQALRSYDREEEGRKMAERVQTAVAGTAIVEAGAIGLGTAVAFLAGSTLADVTGILAAGSLAVLGLFVLPARRSRAKKDLAERIGQMKSQLMEALESQFESELSGSLKRIEEAIAPYSRFVRTERDRFTGARSELEAIRGRLMSLQARLD